MNTIDIDEFFIMTNALITKVNRIPMRGACHRSSYHKIAIFNYLTRRPVEEEIAYAFRIIKY